MAEIIAIDVAKGLVKLVADRALDEINLAWGFKDQLLKLNRKLEYVQAFLEDAANSKHVQKSGLINLWLHKIKDVAYTADNVMDEYAIEIFRRKMELKNRFTEKFRNLFTSSNPVFFHFRMAHKVNEILSLFDEIDKEAKNIGLNRVDIAAKGVIDTNNYDDQLTQTRQHAAANASEFVGRENDQATLLDAICSPSIEGHDLSTIAVVGMGGLGKTTIARRLYGHENISTHFGKHKIWISVSQKFEITKILNEMIESVTSNTSELKNSDAIIRKLQEELKGKKLLVVFDDVWNDNNDSWSSLKGYLHIIGTAPGSVILVTTRSDEVATAAGAVFKHKLKGLSEDESWSLLHQIVFSKSGPPCFSRTEEVGRRIVKKCKGVPLAIKVIGGLLRSKQHLYEWETIEKSETWDLPHDQNQILPWLLLSFNHLPSPSLKQCFAYYPLIPKSNYVDKNELIGLWLSQDYLRNDKQKNLTMEEIGEKYLKILLSNSLIEEVNSDLPGIMGYQMHDLVYDLAVYVCGSDLIKEAIDLGETSTCRHLVFNSVENKAVSEIPPEKALTKLRTLSLKGADIPWNMLIHTRYLRTLNLDRTGIAEVPPAVALLKHLRLLDVSYNPISTLPDSIGKLYQLQTLILQGCKNMKRLPKVVNKLVSLRLISTTAPMFACNGLQQLTNLQSLPNLCLDDDREGWTIDELGDLDQLRDEIHIQGLECVKDKEQARKATLGRKAKVTKLNLSWVEGRGETSGVICDEDVLEGLEPHPNITSLKVTNFTGEKLPTWITRMAVLTEGKRSTLLINLTEIKLLNCNRCQTLPALGQLPLLKCLILSGLDVECIGIDFYGSGDFQTSIGVSFQSLVELELSGFEKLITWTVPQQATFPCLEILRVRECYMLKAIPVFGTKSLLSLELVHLYKVKLVDIIKDATCLTSLIINMLSDLKKLPQELAECRRLQTLEIANCEELISLPIGLKSLVSLQSLTVAYCQKLTCLPEGFLKGHSSLLNLEISGCPSLRMEPADWGGCTSLERFMIHKCPLIKVSPTHISKLQRLSKLRTSCVSAGHLRSVLEAARCLPLLSTLEITGFRDEDEMGDYFSDITSFLRLPSLRQLILTGQRNIKTLPRQLEHLTRITQLYIWDFDDLEEIPDWICNLTSLEYLILERCKSMKKLPSKEVLQRLCNLRALRISECPELAERYAQDDGPEWHNISHIRWIEIDGKEIQDR